METQMQKLRPRLNVALLKQLRVAPSRWSTGGEEEDVRPEGRFRPGCKGLADIVPSLDSNAETMKNQRRLLLCTTHTLIGYYRFLKTIIGYSYSFLLSLG